MELNSFYISVLLLEAHQIIHVRHFSNAWHIVGALWSRAFIFGLCRLYLWSCLQSATRQVPDKCWVNEGAEVDGVLSAGVSQMTLNSGCFPSANQGALPLPPLLLRPLGKTPHFPMAPRGLPDMFLPRLRFLKHTNHSGCTSVFHYEECTFENNRGWALKATCNFYYIYLQICH